MPGLAILGCVNCVENYYFFFDDFLGAGFFAAGFFAAISFFESPFKFYRAWISDLNNFLIRLHNNTFFL